MLRDKSLAWRIGCLRGGMRAGKIGFMLGFVACAVLFSRILAQTEPGQALGTGVPVATIQLFRAGVTMCLGGFGYWAVFGSYADILLFESLFGFYPRLPFRKIDPEHQRIMVEMYQFIAEVLQEPNVQRFRWTMRALVPNAHV